MKEMFKELIFYSKSSFKDFYNDVQFDVLFTTPENDVLQVPGFWWKDNIFKVRYDLSIPGRHEYITSSNDDSLNNIKGYVDIECPKTDNPLYANGAVCRFDDNMYLSHKDKTPFYWFADTWWMSLTKRLRFPEEFDVLLNDRAEKGFNVVQIIAGLYPDMDMFDPRGANEAGFPWEKDFSKINPEYFDRADERIIRLVSKGIMPCVVGSWGFYMGFAGKEILKKHWRYIISRWSALPVCWCVAGEANMAFYDQVVSPEEHLKQSRNDWNDMTIYIKNTDPFKRLITIHPNTLSDGYDQIDQGNLLDLNMLQTGHGSFLSLVNQMEKVKIAVDRAVLPVVNSEVCYEGICASSFSDVQRYIYITDFILGAAGHTYGANGIWQINSKEMPFGTSPHGSNWGNTSWQEAMNYDGARHISNCMKYLTSFPWWRFEYHPEWLEAPCSLKACDGSFCAGIPREIRIIFKPFFGGPFWGNITVQGIESDVSYCAFRFNPVTGEETCLGDISVNEEGKWRFPRADAFQDWIYVLKANKPIQK